MGGLCSSSLHFANSTTHSTTHCSPAFNFFSIAITIHYSHTLNVPRRVSSGWPTYHFLVVSEWKWFTLGFFGNLYVWIRCQSAYKAWKQSLFIRKKMPGKDPQDLQQRSGLIIYILIINVCLLRGSWPPVILQKWLPSKASTVSLACSLADCYSHVILITIMTDVSYM